MGLLNEIKSKNFSLYAQWLGLISIALLAALGAVCLLSNPIFAIIGWVIAGILVFVEVTLFSRFCCISDKFTSFISWFENTYCRAALYFIFAITMFLSRILNTTLLIIPAVTLLFTGFCYLIAALKKQTFASSTIVGGTGVDNAV